MLFGTTTLSTESGIELWNGNNGFLFSHYPQESSDLSKSDAMQALSLPDQRYLERIANDEELTNRWFFHKALAYIQAHPRQTVYRWIAQECGGLFIGCQARVTVGPRTWCMRCRMGP